MPTSRRVIYIKNPSSGSHFRTTGGAGGGTAGQPGVGTPQSGGVNSNSINIILNQANLPNLPNYEPAPITGFVAGLTDAFGNSLYAPTSPFGNSNPFGNTNVVSPKYAPDIPSPDGATYADFGAPFKAMYNLTPFGTPGTLNLMSGKGMDPLHLSSHFNPGPFPTYYQTPSNIGNTSEPIDPGPQDIVGAIVKIVKKKKKKGE